MNSLPNKSRRFAPAVTGFLILLLTIEDSASAATEFTPDPNIQRVIGEIIEAVRHDDENFYSQLEALKEKFGPTYTKLIPELMYHSSRAQIWFDAMVGIMVIERLGIQDGYVVKALLPYVDAQDETFRKRVRGMIALHEPGFRSPAHRFKYVLEPIVISRRKGEPPPAGLVEFLYRARPGLSLLEMARIYEGDRRQFLWSEHVVSDAIWKKQHKFDEKFREAKPEAVGELQKLSTHEAWWVCLYVAEIVVQHEEFRTEEMIDRLKTDEHQLVKQAIARIDAQKNKPQPKPRPVPRDNDTDGTEALNDADPGMPPP